MEEQEGNMAYDCCYGKEDYWFRLRTGAIIVRDGKMLFVRNTFGGYFYMLGGGVHLGEDSRTCIEREVLEETGVPCKPVRPLIICENFFNGVGGNIDGKECHTLEYYYLMEIPEGAVFEQKNDEEEELVWVPIDEFADNDIRPSFLKEKIREVLADGNLIHIIHDTRNFRQEN